MSIRHPASTADYSVEAWTPDLKSQTLYSSPFIPYLPVLTFSLSNCMDLHICRPLCGDEEDWKISSSGRRSLALSHAVATRRISGSINETVITFRSCHGTRSHMRSGFETCLRNLSDTDFWTDIFGARQRCGLRANRYRRSYRPYLGVGPGIELPTRMHLFEGALNGGGLAHTTPGRGLRRVPVVNFESFRAAGESGNEILPRIFTSEFEQHLFDDLPLPLNGCAARHRPNDVEYIADGESEARPGEAAVSPYGSVDSEQLAIRHQLGSSIDQSLHQGQTGLLNNYPSNEAQAVDSASIRRSGPALSEHGLDGTAEEILHAQDAAFEHTPQADDGETEASQDDIRSVSSSSSDEPIIFTPGSSV